MNFKKVKKKLNSIRIALTLGMASADKIILNDNSSKVPEGANIVSQNYSRHDFIRSIQQGKFTEQQLIMFYKLLDKFDKNHGRIELIKLKDGYHDENGEWIEPEFAEFLLNETDHEKIKQELGDYEPGYKTILFLTNKDIQLQDISILGMSEFDGCSGKELDEAIKKHSEWVPTLEIFRDYITYGVPKIEDYCNEIFIKIKNGQDFTKDNNCLVEFYCFNFNRKRVKEESRDGIFGEVNENLFEKLHQAYTLEFFKNFIGFSIKELTATRNDLPHLFKIKEYKEIKKLSKGFVIKFFCEKI